MVWECQEVQGGSVPLHKSLCGDLGGRGDTLQEPESKRPAGVHGEQGPLGERRSLPGAPTNTEGAPFSPTAGLRVTR